MFASTVALSDSTHTAYGTVNRTDITHLTQIMLVAT